MNQYSKRQLKTPTCFGSFGIHPQVVLKRVSLKLLEMFCVRSQVSGSVKFGPVVCVSGAACSQLAAPETHTTGPNFTLPNCRF